MTDTKVHENVQEYYGKVLQTSKDLKTSACCAAEAPHPAIRAAMSKIPSEVIEKFYGCGNPVPLGIQGLSILDLGSGSGRDCYTAAALVGSQGHVTGVDMTDEQLEVARKHAESFTRTLGYDKCNLTFLKGYIENLSEAGVKDDSIDIAISNCVVNLSPDKLAVLRGVFQALKKGGEFHFSDVYSDVSIPSEIRSHPVLHGECLAGALSIDEFLSFCRTVGFSDPRILSAAPIEVHDTELKPLVEGIRFFSVTYRLFKIDGLSTSSEADDFGEVFVYQGTLQGQAERFVLDTNLVFPAHVPIFVDGNTALILRSSWLSSHFEAHGSRSQRFGSFARASKADLAAVIAALPAAKKTATCCPAPAAPAAASSSSASCCPPPAAPAASSSSASCCPPPAAAAAAASASCCPPLAAAAASASCCPPPAAAGKTSCC